MDNECLNDELRRKLGLRIKRLREEQGFSQRTFASMIGMGRTYLVEVEQGKRNIAFNNLANVARGFGMTLSDLFECIIDD